MQRHPRKGLLQTGEPRRDGSDEKRNGKRRKLAKIRKRWWVVAALLIGIAAGGIALYVRVNSID